MTQPYIIFLSSITQCVLDSYFIDQFFRQKFTYEAFLACLNTLLPVSISIDDECLLVKFSVVLILDTLRFPMMEAKNFQILYMERDVEHLDDLHNACRVRPYSWWWKIDFSHDSLGFRDIKPISREGESNVENIKMKENGAWSRKSQSKREKGSTQVLRTKEATRVIS